MIHFLQHVFFPGFAPFFESAEGHLFIMIPPYPYSLFIRSFQSHFYFLLNYLPVVVQNFLVLVFPKFFIVAQNDQSVSPSFVEGESRSIQVCVFLEVIGRAGIAFVMIRKDYESIGFAVERDFVFRFFGISVDPVELSAHSLAQHTGPLIEILKIITKKRCLCYLDAKNRGQLLFWNDPGLIV